METEFLWNLFCTTGDPVAYVLYRASLEDAAEAIQSA